MILATQLLTITDPRNNVVLTSAFDTQGRVDTQTLANGGVWDYEYASPDPACSGKTKVTSPVGAVTCVQIAADGFILEKTIGLGTPDVRTFTYNRNPATKLLTTVTDSFHSRVTRYAYQNALVSEVSLLDGTAGETTSSFTYEGSTAALHTVTDPLFHTTTYDHDADGCLSQITDASGKVSQFACTSFGGPASVLTYPSGVGSPAVGLSLAYSRGDPISIVTDAGTLADPDGTQRRQRVLVDDAGNVRLVRDHLRYETKQTYDRLNRLTSSVDARGKVTVYEYDVNGNLTKITDPRNGVTRFDYNSSNFMFQRTDQVGRLDTYTFDALGHIKTWIDRRGKTMVYCYDALAHPTFAGFGAAGSQPNCQSSLESSITYDYDAGGRLIELVDTTGASTQTISRTYDDLDRLLTESTPEGAVTNEYDDAGRRETMTVGGEPTVVFGYFANNLPMTITQSSQTVSYAYDGANRLSTRTLPNGVSETYSLNAAGDLTQIAYTDGQNLGSISYSYDAIGRRNAAWDAQARLALPAATTGQAVYDAANRPTSWNGATISHDLAGNLTNDGTTTFAWNTRSQLISTSTGKSFTYDGFGRRSSSTASGTTKRYLYDGLNAVQEKNAAGSPVANSLFGTQLDEVLWRKPVGGAGLSYLSDALGSTVATTDSSGALASSYTYEPYGRMIQGDTSNPFTFTGREQDTSGVQFNRARYYSSATGRFMSEDPIREAGGPNLYNYSNSSPISEIDPLGLDSDCAERSRAISVVATVVTGLGALVGLYGRIVGTISWYVVWRIALLALAIVLAVAAIMQAGLCDNTGPYLIGLSDLAGASWMLIQIFIRLGRDEPPEGRPRDPVVIGGIDDGACVIIATGPYCSPLEVIRG